MISGPNWILACYDEFMKVVSPKASYTLYIIVSLSWIAGCASQSEWQDPGLSYTNKEFVQYLHERVPNLTEQERIVPFSVPLNARQLARSKLRGAPGGLNPVEILVATLTAAEPDGLGLVYDWRVAATAREALDMGRGDCVSMAMVLVGLGRSLNWPIYFAQARPQEPSVHEFAELTVLSSHMVVIVLTQQGPIIVDFLGLIDKADYDIRPIDDLSAYAHLINNVAGHELVNNTAADSTDRAAWTAAKYGFLRATQVQPDLGRAWNNLGIVHSRLGEFSQARGAYARAIELDTIFGSPQRNLTIMETRMSNPPTILRRNLSK